MTSNSSARDAQHADTRVVIVGAGPVGMFLALDLAAKGVRSTLIEQSATHRVYPKGDTHNARTMEHYRRLGLAEAVRAVGLPPDHPTNVVYLTRFNGYELKRLRMPSSAEKMAEVAAQAVTSQVPEPVHRANQMYVEKVLFDRLLATEAVTCRFGTEFLGFDEADSGVTVRVRPAEGGPEETMNCQYLVGCDGARSLVRRQLGILYEGEEEETGFRSGLRHSRYLRISRVVKEVIREPAWQYWFVTPGRIASLITLDGREEFKMSVYAGNAEDDDAVRAFVDDCVGEQVDTEILGGLDWVNGLALVADSYGRGRVLICGDAAHLFTPIGGFGMNTGIEDAANLAWKLAATVQGWAGPYLVDSYGTERRPAGIRNTQAAISLGRPLRDIPLDETLEEDTPEGEKARGRGCAGPGVATRIVRFAGGATGHPLRRLADRLARRRAGAGKPLQPLRADGAARRAHAAPVAVADTVPFRRPRSWVYPAAHRPLRAFRRWSGRRGPAPGNPADRCRCRAAAGTGPLRRRPRFGKARPARGVAGGRIPGPGRVADPGHRRTHALTW